MLPASAEERRVGGVIGEEEGVTMAILTFFWRFYFHARNVWEWSNVRLGGQIQC